MHLESLPSAGMARKAFVTLPPEQLAAAANYKVGRMASLCGVSIRQLQRDFRRRVGSSPQAWLHERKMHVARERLLAGEPVKIVALDLGFKHVPNFCEWFKALNGITATGQIKQLFPDAKIVIVTNYDDSHLRQAAYRAGACHYVLKRNLFDICQILIANEGSKPVSLLSEETDEG